MKTTIHDKLSVIDPDAPRKWTPAAEPAFNQVTAYELARSCSDAFVDLDLTQRVAAIRSIVPAVFTTCFGIEDQAIAHAIFWQALAIDVVTLDTGRLFPETYEVWARAERRYGRCIQPFCPDRLGVKSLVARQGINGFYISIAGAALL